MARLNPFVLTGWEGRLQEVVSLQDYVPLISCAMNRFGFHMLSDDGYHLLKAWYTKI